MHVDSLSCTMGIDFPCGLRCNRWKHRYNEWNACQDVRCIVVFLKIRFATRKGKGVRIEIRKNNSDLIVNLLFSYLYRCCDVEAEKIILTCDDKRHPDMICVFRVFYV